MLKNYFLGISQLAVVVNKLDTVDWSENRFNEIVDKLSVFLKQAGFKDNVTFVPCSGLCGENIVTKPKESLSNWYNYHFKSLLNLENCNKMLINIF